MIWRMAVAGKLFARQCSQTFCLLLRRARSVHPDWQITPLRGEFAQYKDSKAILVEPARACPSLLAFGIPVVRARARSPLCALCSGTNQRASSLHRFALVLHDSAVPPWASLYIHCQSCCLNAFTAQKGGGFHLVGDSSKTGKK